MTANVLPQQVVELRAAGLDDHVGKPFRTEALLAVIDRWAGRGAEPPRPATSIDRTVLAEMTEMVGPERMGDLLAMLAKELTQTVRDRCPAGESRSADAGRARDGVGGQHGGFVALAETCRAVEAACRAGEDVAPMLGTLQARAAETIAEIAVLRAA